MPQYALGFRLLPLTTLLCVASCLSTEGYYRYQDGGGGAAGATGTAGAIGTAGSTGTAGATGAGGSSGGSAAGTTGAAGTVAVGGRGGTTGTAGTGGATGGTTGRGGTTGTAGSTGRGGATGTAGSTGAGGVLFMDDFETGTDGWDFTASTPAVVTDGSTKVLSMTESAGDQLLGAAGASTWTNFSVEAKVKVTAFAQISFSPLIEELTSRQTITEPRPRASEPRSR